MESIVEIVANHSINQPDKLCLADNDNHITYNEYFRYILGFSKYLERVGVKKGDSIIVRAKQNINYLISGLSIQLLGAVFIPVEKMISDTAISEIADITDAKYFIADVKPDYECTYISYSEIIKQIWEGVIPYHDLIFPKGSDIAEILFTTGTTGKSKGIELTHNSVIAVSENVKYGVAMNVNNIELIPVPLNHSHGLRRYYANMLNGSTVIITDGVIFIERLFKMMDFYHITSIDLVPAMLSIILKLSKDRLSLYNAQLDYIQIGSAKLSENEKDKLRDLLPNVRLYDFYGSTEAGCSCILEFSKYHNKIGCIGKPTYNSRFIFVDEKGDKIQSSSKKPGFIATGGSMIMKGYYKDEGLTAESIKDDYIYSTDEGYLGEDGFIYLIGRKDNIINIAGKKVNPEEIEDKVMQNEDILDCACMPIDDEIAGQVPILYIVMKEGKEFSQIAMYDYLISKLEDYKVPKIIEEVKKIPRSYNGKIMRKSIQEYITNKK